MTALVLTTVFTAVLTTALAADPAGPADLAALEARALAQLQGRAGCHRVRIDARTEASVPVVYSDEERVRATGRLDSGVWSGLSAQVLSDSDPDDALFEGAPLPFGEPGLGTLPGTAADDDVDSRRFEAVLQPADALRWRAGRLERSTSGAGPTGPWASWVHVADGQVRGVSAHVQGEADTTWTMAFDAQGRATKETTQSSFSMMDMTVTLTQTLSYTWLGGCD